MKISTRRRTNAKLVLRLEKEEESMAKRDDDLPKTEKKVSRIGRQTRARQSVGCFLAHVSRQNHSQFPLYRLGDLPDASSWTPNTEGVLQAGLNLSSGAIYNFQFPTPNKIQRAASRQARAHARTKHEARSTEAHTLSLSRSHTHTHTNRTAPGLAALLLNLHLIISVCCRLLPL